MGLKDIVDRLDSLFDTKKNRAVKQADAIGELVEKLVKKEAKYQARLAETETERDQKKLKRKIKVCQAQIAKGRAILVVPPTPS